MKKIIYSVLVLALAAFTFTSCEDVPEPYEMPQAGAGNSTAPTVGTGTIDDPYNVASAKAQNAGTADKAVRGYIVGFINGKSISSDAVLAAGTDNPDATSSKTNIIIADDPSETVANNCMPIQLPAGDIRTKLNLIENPGNYKKQVVLYGNIESYFGAKGLKSTSYALLDGTEIGTKPGVVVPVGPAEGDGTFEKPYNVAGIIAYTSALGKDEQSPANVYFKGKIASIDQEFNTQYGNASFNISEDGQAGATFKVWRTLYLGNRKYVDGDTQIKVGDEVMICGLVTNYYGNTPETVTNKSYIYSLNGVTEGQTVEPENPDTPDTPDIPGNPDVEDGESVVLVAADLGYENQTAVTTLTLNDGTTLTFDAGGNSNGPKYYTTGTAIRMYPKNTVKIASSKAIAKVIMLCDNYNNQLYNILIPDF